MSTSTTPDSPDNALCSDSVDLDSAQFPDENHSVIPDITTVFSENITDQWIHSELNLPQGELLQREKVVSLCKDGNVKIKASCDPNTFLNCLNYDAEFPNGKIK